MRYLKIGDREIRDAPFLIAEVGHNHMGRVDVAIDLARAARVSGFHAYKLQKRTNRTLYTRAMLQQPYSQELAYGRTYGLHREALEFGLTEYGILSGECKVLGLAFFATAFDETAADFLADINVPAYKIASGGATDLPLLRYVARKGKPMIVSTGGCTLDDVKRMYDTVMPLNDQLCIMQCTASYPCKPEHLNLRVIETYLKEFPENVIGFSDHQDGLDMAVAAYALGARVFEKHVTLDHSAKGTDHPFSLEPEGMARYAKQLARVAVAMGSGDKRPLDIEAAPLRKMRRSLHAKTSLPEGEILDPEEVALKSPEEGMPAWKWDRAIGKRLTKPFEEDEPLSSGLME